MKCRRPCLTIEGKKARTRFFRGVQNVYARAFTYRQEPTKGSRTEGHILGSVCTFHNMPIDGRTDRQERTTSPIKSLFTLKAYKSISEDRNRQGRGKERTREGRDDGKKAE